MRLPSSPDVRPRSALTGQGHDDSTLFSLRSLVDPGAAPPRKEAAPSCDDSGLIDLAALAAMHQGRAERPKLDVAPFVGVGLFDVPERAPEPPPPPPEPAPSRAPRRRTVALVAATVTAVAAASAIGMAMTHGTVDARPPLAVPPPAATIPATPPINPPRIETPLSVEAKSTETVAKPRPIPAQGTSRRVPRPPGSAVAKPDPPKPAPPCDLMCQMAKSVAGSR